MASKKKNIPVLFRSLYEKASPTQLFKISTRNTPLFEGSKLVLDETIRKRQIGKDVLDVPVLVYETFIDYSIDEKSKTAIPVALMRVVLDYTVSFGKG